ncbi:BgTH12-02683 [Blumeria graminis f. sp. triticale]|uniref:BgTH12-02683 n=1 Tax=Blumeria graminis f. sp. triticale TaxID=1689686 RepID=A0A9W4D801_BLUGR|nr:BgTH12-02683 [Blumeria graminis f. sp. triticale]
MFIPSTIHPVSLNGTQLFKWRFSILFATFTGSLAATLSNLSSSSTPITQIYAQHDKITPLDNTANYKANKDMFLPRNRIIFSRSLLGFSHMSKIRLSTVVLDAKTPTRSNTPSVTEPILGTSVLIGLASVILWHFRKSKKNASTRLPLKNQPWDLSPHAYRLSRHMARDQRLNCVDIDHRHYYDTKNRTRLHGVNGTSISSRSEKKTRTFAGLEEKNKGISSKKKRPAGIQIDEFDDSGWSYDQLPDFFHASNCETPGGTNIILTYPLPRPQAATPKTNSCMADICREQSPRFSTHPTDSETETTTHLSLIAPTHDTYRDTMSSISFTTNERRDKGWSDPFDLDMPEFRRTCEPTNYKHISAGQSPPFRNLSGIDNKTTPTFI